MIDSDLESVLVESFRAMAAAAAWRAARSYPPQLSDHRHNMYIQKSAVSSLCDDLFARKPRRLAASRRNWFSFGGSCLV